MVGLAIGVVMVLVAPDLMFDEMRRQNPDYADQGLTEGALKTAVLVTAVVGIVWAVAASVFAALVYRRVPWARVALIVSASLAALVCLVATVGNFLLVVPLTAAVAAIVLLVRPDTRAWISGGKPGDPHG
jgi:hypothetical protein